MPKRTFKAKNKSASLDAVICLTVPSGNTSSNATIVSTVSPYWLDFHE